MTYQERRSLIESMNRKGISSEDIHAVLMDTEIDKIEVVILRAMDAVQADKTYPKKS